MEQFRLPAVGDEDHRDINLPFPHLASSPPLLRPSPSALKSPAVNFRRIHQRSRSFSSLEDLKTGDHKMRWAEVEDEERMDMLWEDLNEEPGDGITGSHGGRMSSDFFAGSNRLERRWHGARELFCVKAAHRPALVRILKVLKKLLFIKKSREKRSS